MWQVHQGLAQPMSWFIDAWNWKLSKNLVKPNGVTSSLPEMPAKTICGCSWSTCGTSCAVRNAGGPAGSAGCNAGWSGWSAAWDAECSTGWRTGGAAGSVAWWTTGAAKGRVAVLVGWPLTKDPGNMADQEKQIGIWRKGAEHFIAILMWVPHMFKSEKSVCAPYWPWWCWPWRTLFFDMYQYFLVATHMQTSP